jgi:hypothetical protein
VLGGTPVVECRWLYGGALIGTWLAKNLREQHARRIEEQLIRGGLLLWVRILETEGEESALRILRKHSGNLRSCVPVPA